MEKVVGLLLIFVIGKYSISVKRNIFRTKVVLKYLELKLKIDSNVNGDGHKREFFIAKTCHNFRFIYFILKVFQ